MAGVKFKELFFHISAMIFFAYTLHLSLSIFIPGSTDTYGGRFKFLTFLCLCLQLIYYTLSVVVDLKWLATHRFFNQPSDHEERLAKREVYDTLGKFSLRRTRDYLFATLIFPVTLFVTIFFWGIFSYSPLMMMPLFIRKHIEPHGFYNHAVHTAPLVCSLLESFITFHIPPTKKRKALACVLLFATLYTTWILWIAYRANIWVYPILAKMTPAIMVQFFVGVFLATAVAYFLGVCITSYHWKSKVARVWAKIDKNS